MRGGIHIYVCLPPLRWGRKQLKNPGHWVESGGVEASAFLSHYQPLTVHLLH